MSTQESVGGAADQHVIVVCVTRTKSPTVGNRRLRAEPPFGITTLVTNPKKPNTAGPALMGGMGRLDTDGNASDCSLGYRPT